MQRQKRKADYNFVPSPVIEICFMQPSVPSSPEPSGLELHSAGHMVNKSLNVDRVAVVQPPNSKPFT